MKVNNRLRLKKLFIKLFLIFLLVSADTISKFFAVRAGLALFNQGISFGFLSSISQLLWIVISLVIMALLVVLYCYMNLDRVGEISMILIISGGISNTISRILYNGVPDWIDFDLFGLVSFPSFNLADLMIDFSVVLLIISLLKKSFEFRRTE